MKYMSKMLETETPWMNETPAPAATSSDTTTSTATQKTFASVVKTAQPIVAKPYDAAVAEAGKNEMMSKANEASKNLT